MLTLSHRVSLSLPAMRREERISKVKARKLMGWDRAMNKQSKTRDSFPIPTSMEGFSLPHKTRSLSRVTVFWKDKHHHSELLPLLPTSYPDSVCFAWCHMVWNIPWVSQGRLSQLCPFPTTFAPTVPLLEGWGEEQQRPWHCSHQHACVINTLFNTNPKHNPVSDKEN